MIQVLTPHQLEVAVQHLQNGEVVGIPTETVYGLAGCLTDTDALLKIFKAKERPLFDPLIAHVSLTAEQRQAPLPFLDALNLTHSKSLSTQAQHVATLLIQKFWPGPLTLVLPRGKNVPDLATSGLDTIAVRMPAHPLAIQLITAVGQPLAAPSANRFGRISPTCAQDVVQELGDRIDYVIDGGPCTVGVESTILHIALDGTLTLLRHGGLALEEIAQVTGAQVMSPSAMKRPELGPQIAPGLLPSHYAPSKPMLLLSPQQVEKIQLPYKNLGILSFSAQFASSVKNHSAAPLVVALKQLSEQDLAGSARQLFSSLRTLDENPAVDLIVAEALEYPTGLGFAIQDRLLRAAAKKIPH